MQSSGSAGTAAMCMKEENATRATWLGVLLAAAALTLALAANAGAQDAMAEPTPTPEAAAATAPAEGTAPAGGHSTVSTLPNPELPASGVPVADGAIQLSLEEAITTALERNLG
ncbi:MAG TPA: hypothetical protein VFS60_20460, partial [Thermoanaerobaculia bacterium]|nr:hypothetical protein [Thermoanaerobaculia bacterium]